MRLPILHALLAGWQLGWRGNLQGVPGGREMSGQMRFQDEWAAGPSWDGMQATAWLSAAAVGRFRTERATLVSSSALDSWQAGAGLAAFRRRSSLSWCRRRCRLFRSPLTALMGPPPHWRGRCQCLLSPVWSWVKAALEAPGRRRAARPVKFGCLTCTLQRVADIVRFCLGTKGLRVRSAITNR